MLRNMELVRDICRFIQNSPDEHVELRTSDFPDVSDVTFEAHVRLAVEAGLVEETWADRDSKQLRLTNSGFDFLEYARNEGLWAKAKDALRSSGQPATLVVFAEILRRINLQAVADWMAQPR